MDYDVRTWFYNNAWFIAINWRNSQSQIFCLFGANSKISLYKYTVIILELKLLERYAKGTIIILA